LAFDPRKSLFTSDERRLPCSILCTQPRLGRMYGHNSRLTVIGQLKINSNE
jgi:hypothetical protein